MNKFALSAVIVGAINWGLVALFRYDLIASLFGSSLAVGSRIVYGIIGIAGLWCISLLFRRIDDEIIPHSHR